MYSWHTHFKRQQSVEQTLWVKAAMVWMFARADVFTMWIAAGNVLQMHCFVGVPNSFLPQYLFVFKRHVDTDFIVAWTHKNHIAAANISQWQAGIPKIQDWSLLAVFTVLRVNNGVPCRSVQSHEVATVWSLFFYRRFSCCFVLHFSIGGITIHFF